MKLLLYTTGSQKIVERIKTGLKLSGPDGIMEVYRTINDLSWRLRQPKDDPTILVLAPAIPEDILDLFAIRHLFRNCRIVFVAPDLENETLSIAHRLRPRFLSYNDGDFGELCIVVSKMLKG
jgi:hypothetical protein